MATALLENKETKKATEYRGVFRPPIALYETPEAYILLVELPGVDEKTVKVSLERGNVTIEAASAVVLPPEAVSKYCEIRLGNLRRTFEVGDHVDSEKIEATFKSGLLKLVMGKSKSAKVCNIPIKSV